MESASHLMPDILGLSTQYHVILPSMKKWPGSDKISSKLWMFKRNFELFHKILAIIATSRTTRGRVDDCVIRQTSLGGRLPPVTAASCVPSVPKSIKRHRKPSKADIQFITNLTVSFPSDIPELILQKIADQHTKPREEKRSSRRGVLASKFYIAVKLLNFYLCQAKARKSENKYPRLP
jgi:hypothetical protein